MEKWVLENDSKSDNTTKPYDKICIRSKKQQKLLFSIKNYKVSISIATAATEVHPVHCVFETGACPTPIWEEFLSQEWNNMIRTAHARDLKSETSESVRVLGIITLHVRMSDCLVHVNLGTVRNLAVPVFLSTTCMDRFVESIFQMERKVVLFNSKQVSIMILAIQTSKDGQGDNR